MPSQVAGVNQVSPSVPAFLNYLQGRLVALENFVGEKFPGSEFVPGGDINLSGNNIVDVGSATVQTLNYTTLNPPVSAGGYIIGPASATPGDLVTFSSTTGKAASDSGIAAGSVTTADTLYAQTGAIAPPGQRDLWQYSASGAIGEILVYLSGIDILLNSSTGASGIVYSTNGGATFTPVTFDVPATGTMGEGWNGSLAVAISMTAGTQTYTSHDGIHWAIGPAAPQAINTDCNIAWSSTLGLFFTGTAIGAPTGIMTSPDGLTWTLQSLPSLINAVRASPTICVAAGNGIYYSTDCITWTAITLPTVNPIVSVAWSATRGEFLALGTLGSGYVSRDGITWIGYGAIAPVSLRQGLCWIAPDDRYYLNAFDSNRNYSLWSTPDPTTIPFISTHLDGAQQVAISSSPGQLAYMTPRASFALSISGFGPYVAYSTPRNDLKAISDNIRVRGAPVAVALFSSYGGSAITGTSDIDLTTGGSSIGSLLLQAAQPTGMVIHVRVGVDASNGSGASDVFTIKLKANGISMLAHPLTIPNGASASATIIDADFTVEASNLQVSSLGIVNGGATTTLSGFPAYTPTQPNTLQLTGAWASTGTGVTATPKQIIISAYFPNGA